MSIIEKMTKAVNEGDQNIAKEMIHDDYKFLMHSSGKSLTKEDVVKWVGMKDVKKEKVRVLLKMTKSALNMQWLAIVMATKKLLCLTINIKMEK